MWVVKGFWCWSFHRDLILGVHRRSRIMWQHWQESSCHSGGQVRRPPCPQGVPCIQQCPHALLARPPAASRCTLRGGGLHWLPFLRRHLGHWELRELSLTIFTSEEAVVDKDFFVTETSPWCDHNDWKMRPHCLISRLARVWKWTEALVNWLEQRGRQAPPLLLYKHQVQVHMFTSTEVHKYNQAQVHCQRQAPPHC